MREKESKLTSVFLGRAPRWMRCHFLKWEAMEEEQAGGAGRRASSVWVTVNSRIQASWGSSLSYASPRPDTQTVSYPSPVNICSMHGS